MTERMTKAAMVRAQAKQLLDQGLVVVPYVAPHRRMNNAGKRPLWRSYPAPAGGNPQNLRRVEITDHHDLDPWLAIEPLMNIAVLGMAQVDADDAESLGLARSLGVTSDAAVWLIRTRRGWRALYRPPVSTERLRPVTKNGASRGDIEGWRTGDKQLIELDLLINVPAVVPPSVHPKSMKPYTWAEGHSPADITFADLEPPPMALEAHWRKLIGPPPAPQQAPLHQPHEFNEAILRYLDGWVHDKHPPRQKTSRWWDAWLCPYPGHADTRPSFGVNFDRGVWKCWSHGLPDSGSLQAFVREMGIITPQVTRLRGGQVSASRPVKVRSNV